jgi:hypothetical protein
MSNADVILRFLEGRNGCCDDCIAAETHIEPRQQVNQICHRLEPQITRRQDRCTWCGRTKTVNVIQVNAPQTQVEVSPRTLATMNSPDSHVRARLICGRLELNDVDVVDRLLQAAAKALSDPEAWHALAVYRQCYFRTPDGRLSSDPGWYVICDATRAPLYVGKAENLDARLNTTNGSLDQFANSRRTQEPARNFIKALSTMGYIRALHVAVIREPDLLRRVGVQGPLEDIDRSNVEKLLGLFRHMVTRSGV